MKKQMAIVGAAAAALMMAGTAHAENGGGFVGLSYSNNNDTSVNSWTVDGAFAAGDNIQIDAGYSRLDGGGNSANAYSVGGHLFTRSNQWLWGGYVGYDSISDSGDAHEWTVAGQTQYYMDHATLSGNLSYSSVNLLGSDVHTTQIDGEARIFATDNFSIQGNVGYGNIDASGSSGHFWSYGAGAEWKPYSMPISFTAGVEAWNGNGSDTSAWTIGARYTWGGSLLERNRSGASLNQPHGLLSLLF